MIGRYDIPLWPVCFVHYKLVVNAVAMINCAYSIAITLRLTLYKVLRINLIACKGGFSAYCILYYDWINLFNYLHQYIFG